MLESPRNDHARIGFVVLHLRLLGDSSRVPRMSQKKSQTRKARFPHEPGKCQVCADEGILPSEAVACYLHSTLVINELRGKYTR